MSHERDKEQNTEDIEVNIPSLNIKIDTIKFNKMCFLFNALEKGWTVQKKNTDYVFRKKHEGKEEIFNDDYLSIFMKDNLNIQTFFS
jgi:hypothetical protein